MTSTGLAPEPPDALDVELMREELGAGIALKGWLTKADVVNTLPLAALRGELRKKRDRAVR